MIRHLFNLIFGLKLEFREARKQQRLYIGIRQAVVKTGLIFKWPSVLVSDVSVREA